MKKRIIIGISGASGVGVGIELLKYLNTLTKYETHVIISDAAKKVLKIEGTTADLLELMGSWGNLIFHDPSDIGSSIASGSFCTKGMIIVPCTINTLSKISYCHSDDLMTRAADVCLKEGRKLVLSVRETPFHSGHLEMMLKLSKMGVSICPFIPSFYSKPETISDLITQYCGRLLDQIGIENNLVKRWEK